MADVPDRPHYRLAVRTLTEFVCRRGDIHFRYDSATQGREGIERLLAKVRFLENQR